MQVVTGSPADKAGLARGDIILSVDGTAVNTQSDLRNILSQHKAGDRFLFDGAGNLLTAKNPERICMGALYPLGPLVYAVSELHYAGADPGALRFNRTGCFDVGVRCGGWGRVVMEVRVE